MRKFGLQLWSANLVFAFIEAFRLCLLERELRREDPA